MVFLFALPLFLVCANVGFRSLNRCWRGDELDKQMVRDSPFVLWDCGTSNSERYIWEDGCAVLATALHVPFRVRYDRGGMHGRSTFALIRQWNGSFTWFSWETVSINEPIVRKKYLAGEIVEKNQTKSIRLTYPESY